MEANNLTGSKKMSSLRSFTIILIKEVVDNFRDRRTLTTMAVSIIAGPLILFGFIWFAEKTVKEETDLVNAEAIELPVIGSEYAPNLMNWLRQNNVEVLEPPSDPSASIKSKQFQMVLVIEEGFSSAFSSGETAPIRLIHDSSVSQFEKIDYETVRRAIASYSQRIGAMRLNARGVNPKIVNAIQINLSDIAPANARGAQMLTMLPYLLIIFIMVGGMYLAIDTTAGEREKGSLEPLLTQPVSRKLILLAKLGATIVFSSLTLLLILSGLAVGFEYMQIDAFSLSVGAVDVLKVFIACLPFVFVGCSLMILIASFTKSYKEAQSYLGMVMILPSMPLMLLVFMSPVPSFENMWVPSLSQALIIIETFKGETVPAHLVGLSMAASTLFAAMLAFIAIKLYRQERILG